MCYCHEQKWTQSEKLDMQRLAALSTEGKPPRLERALEWETAESYYRVMEQVSNHNFLFAKLRDYDAGTESIVELGTFKGLQKSAAESEQTILLTDHNIDLDRLDRLYQQKTPRLSCIFIANPVASQVFGLQYFFYAQDLNFPLYDKIDEKNVILNCHNGGGITPLEPFDFKANYADFNKLTLKCPACLEEQRQTPQLDYIPASTIVGSHESKSVAYIV